MTYRDRQAWQDRKPVYNRLPLVGYQDNTVAEALTSWVDEKLSSTKDLIESWYLELSPETCKDGSLDYLAYLCGFSGDYWDPEWEPEVKRSLIRLSHQYLWRYKGTLKVLQTVLGIHSVDHNIWTADQLRLSFRLSGRFGTEATLRFYVRLPLETLRGGEDWTEAERTVKAYSPAICRAKVTYKRFYLGFSRLGDPLFSS